MFSPKLKKHFLRLFFRPESLYSVATFYGAQNGWIVRSVRPKTDAKKLLAYLERIDSDRIHKASFCTFS